ncbi:MAG: hypothetical protein RL557_208 [archaeon]|jgi:hypothetical protein
MKKSLYMTLTAGLLFCSLGSVYDGYQSYNLSYQSTGQEQTDAVLSERNQGLAAIVSGSMGAIGAVGLSILFLRKEKNKS